MSSLSAKVKYLNRLIEILKLDNTIPKASIRKIPKFDGNLFGRAIEVIGSIGRSIVY